MAAPAVNRHPTVAAELYVVSATDSVTQTLSGHPGLIYTSPPQAYQDALRLAAGLLGHQPTPPDSGAHVWRWSSATAGGRRVVTLALHHQGEDHGNAARC